MKATFDGETRGLPDAPRLSLVFNQTHGESQYPGRVTITPEVSMAHYAIMGEPDAVTQALFRLVVADWHGPVSRKTLDAAQPVFRQVAGMFGMTVQAMAQRKPFAWKYPENGLHPRYQLNLADAAIILSSGAALEKFLRSAQLLH